MPFQPRTENEAYAKMLGEHLEEFIKLTPEQLAANRVQFCHDDPLNVRALVCHMVKNTIYKNGQLFVLFFALGLDGTEPYIAPFPNADYEACYGPSRTE